VNRGDWLARLPSPLASAKPGEPRQWYRIDTPQGAADSTGETVADEVDVFVYGVIGGWWSGVDAKSFIKAIQDIKAKQLNIHISSVGGSVFEGLAIFQALRNHSARIVTYVDALAASSASIVAMAGDRRVVAPYASVMVHRAWNFYVGNDIELRKCADEMERLTRNMARVYANRGTSGATVDEWLDVMTEETWYYGEEAVEAGLMHEVQEDPEKTGGDDSNPTVVPGVEDDDEDDEGYAMNRFAMDFFGFTGRDRSAAPRMPRTAATVDPEGESTPEPSLATAPDPEVSGAEPESENRTEEDDVSTELSDISSRLGLADDADKDAVYAAIDELKAKAETPAQPEPDPEAQAALAEQTRANADLSEKVNLLTEQVQAMGAQLAAVNAEKAATVKAGVIRAAMDKGKFPPADLAKWEARYDKSPEVTTEVLAAIPDFSAVPLAAIGETGDPEPSGETFDAGYDRLFGEKASA
jgi:ATP-dependent protease ClpP protease subunit